MKWLILLGIIFIALALVAYRYRAQIKMAIYVWRMFRKMRQASKTDEKQIEKKGDSKDVALVRCAKCGTWIPQVKALKLRSGINYCSANCMETMANIN